MRQLVMAILVLLLWARTAQAAGERPIVAGPADHRAVALTFDDGPSAATPQILAVLRAFRVHATFFDVGYEVRALPGLVRAEVAGGDEVGNHTYTHPDLDWLPDAEVDWQIERTQQTIHEAAGVTPRWFRPPYGAVNDRVVHDALRAGLRTVVWSVDPRDWARPGVSAIVWTVLASARPGSVILLHDGGGDRSETTWALPAIIRGLQARGYHFETLNALMAPPVQTRPSHVRYKPVTFCC